MSGAVTIRRCATLSEALICQGLLQANGLHCSVDNYYHSANEWWLVPAFNGVSLSVFQNDRDEARRLIIEHAETGPALLEQEFGPYETPRKYGVIAAWYMLLDYTLKIPSLVIAVLLTGLFSLIGQFTPEEWWRQPDVQTTQSWVPEVRVGTYNPVYETSFELEGLLLLIAILLVFLADRLIKPPTVAKDDTQ
ncbi:hypothetical protein [Henriciella sp.]|uniref:hypothetical protein n=1 Tax=Henriciella sp. TaxID=1968823 RepID=UPI00262058CF|nr:hypothetical protein [Henriciella sp.]